MKTSLCDHIHLFIHSITISEYLLCDKHYSRHLVKEICPPLRKSWLYGAQILVETHTQ